MKQKNISKIQIFLASVQFRIFCFILLVTISCYIFLINNGVINILYSDSVWANDRMSTCLEDCEIGGEIILIVIPPDISSNYGSDDIWNYKVELKRVAIYANKVFIKGELPDRICIDKVTLNHNVFFDKPICSENGNLLLNYDFDLETAPSVSEGIIFGYSLDTSEYYNKNFSVILYPFTQFSVPARIQFYFHSETNGIRKEGTLYPGLYIQNKNYLVWNLKIDEQTAFINREYPIDTVGGERTVKEKVTILYIDGSTPILHKVLIIVLFSGLFILICFLFTLSDTSVFIQGVTAMLFGMYSIKQILLPKEILDANTIIDFGYFVLYMCLGYVIIDHSFHKLNYKTPFLEKKSEKLIGTRLSQYFHKHSCIRVRNIKKENVIYFDSDKEAVEMGKIPCSYCSKKVA